MVGPGGVALVETKWGGTPWDADAGDIAFRTALEQTGRNAKQLALWHGVAKYGRPDVEPVLVVWGPAARQLRDFGARRHASGVVVMSGDHLREWMMGRRRDRLTPAQVDGIYAEMDRHLVRRDARERVTRPMPRSIADSSRPPWPASGSPFLMTNWLLQLTASVFAWIGTGLALVGVAEAHASSVGGPVVPDRPCRPLPADNGRRGARVPPELSRRRNPTSRSRPRLTASHHRSALRTS